MELAGKLCNLCKKNNWNEVKNRGHIQCSVCGSYERTRAVKIVLEEKCNLRQGMRILHLAPEKGIASWLTGVCGSGYEPADLTPSRYPHVNARKLDLISDVVELPSNYYDLILHNHVLEHIPCSLAHVLFHLHRALSPDGYHVFSLPLMSGHYDEYFGPLDSEAATIRFGQFDHVRRFGVEDIDRHLGQLLSLDLDYSLYDFATAPELDCYNIPESERKGLNGSTIFVVRKHDYLLV